MRLPAWTFVKLDELARFYEGSTHKAGDKVEVYVPIETWDEMRAELYSFERVTSIEARVIGGPTDDTFSVELHLGDNPHTVNPI